MITWQSVLRHALAPRLSGEGLGDSQRAKRRMSPYWPTAWPGDIAEAMWRQ
jgi:hypothetical protein